MKQHLTKEQTQHLIKLGFPKPKSVIDILDVYGRVETAYSIGELIEFLGIRLMGIKLMETYEVYAYKKTNNIEYVDWIIKKGELIDALYTALIELKENGSIKE